LAGSVVRIGPAGAKSAPSARLQALPPLLRPLGEKCGLVKRKGVVVRRGLKEAWSKLASR